MPDQFLPAGLSLTQVVHSYPRHAWGSMLRVYMAEGWTAERMWNHLPHDFRRNQGAQRPWNYIQAAMGREVDKMFEEETGRKRVPIPRPRVPSVAAENPSEDDDDPSEGEEDQSEDEENPNEDESGTETNPPPRPLKTHADLTLDQLKKIAYIADHKVNEIEQRIIALKPEATQEYRSIWKKAQDEWYQAQMDAYKRDTGRDLRHSRKPNLVLREVWKTGYPRSDDEGLAEYHARADWNAWYKLTKQFQDLEKARRAQLQQMQLELANATTARIDG
ncbi:uncharacterized protein A1O5_05830 [Cladophialophora psammophila CBS 110553]|uniref:Uncharacterized protein n=1 Tax=Cladophialophora psammophila CBS 110553 TaxID=1182543 RepID=W9XKG7_9EURO|nr:uncharacterized protein A1O5_05830 [Cladophialophora psammophila CBS 110553]EXJ70839.1 hypothetical protein A1O5_05830 [Cladophialophora psammophila CBS 110553]